MSGRRVLAVLCAAAVAMIVGCAERATSPADQPTHAAPADDARPARVRLDAAAVARAGVRSAVVERAEGRSEVDAFGRVLDPLPFVELRHARAAARAAVVVARAESERVARLHREDQNASTRDVEAARGALDKATADLDVLSARLALGWGAALDASDDVVAELVAGRVALVRVDLPAGVVLSAPSATVSLRGTARSYLARVLGRAPAADPLVQGEGWLALVDDDPPPPGALLPVTVPTAAEPTAGAAIPPSALVWVDARPAVYAETAAGEFERRLVTLGPRVDDRWIVTAGIAPGERVVVAGVAMLLSSELVSAEPSED